jgi:predicted Zn-dependent protease
MIAAIVLGAKSNELGQAAMASLAAGNIQSRINFTRANEKEADNIGIELLANAGFDPESMADFFNQLHKQTRLYGPQAPEFLRTHPVTDTRIADAENRASHYQHKTPQNSEAFHLMRNRIEVLTAENQHKLQKRFADNLESGSYSNENAERYGYALSLLQTGDFKLAARQLQKLLQQEPQRIAFLIAQADLEFRQGQVSQALSRYRAALKLYPENPALTLGYAETLLNANQAKQAQQILHDFLRDRDRNPRFYQLLADAEARLGHTAQSQMAMGEYYYRIGHNQQAVTQLTLALKDTSLNFYESARIEARLKELKSEIAALQASTQ